MPAHLPSGARTVVGHASVDGQLAVREFFLIFSLAYKLINIYESVLNKGKGIPSGKVLSNIGIAAGNVKD